MAIYAISDLHLSFANSKPMSIFGEKWKNHEEKIKKKWVELVKEDDTILMPGDFSWAMKLEDTYLDFKYLNSLPGKKILSKGNHDYWWSTLLKLNKFMQENEFNNISFLYNNSFQVEDKIICGTRGWLFNDTEESKRILQREALRLEMSIQSGIEKWGADKPLIVCMHYPPIAKEGNNIFIDVLKKYKVEKCIYGHLHGNSHNDAMEGIIHGIDFKLVSADYLNFNILKIDM